MYLTFNGMLRRSENEKMLGGVCGGIARWLDWDPTTVRVLYVLGSIFTAGSGTLLYIILWVVIPAE